MKIMKMKKKKIILLVVGKKINLLKKYLNQKKVFINLEEKVIIFLKIEMILIHTEKILKKKMMNMNLIVILTI